MKIVILLLLVSACNYGPAPMTCDDCHLLCRPFPSIACQPVQAAESGAIIYVRCKCGESKP
jgi:hypothetical protein